MKPLLIALALGLAAPAAAQDTEGAVYHWRDRQGQDHYTDDPASIPPEHRKAAKKTAGRELFEVSAEREVVPPPDAPAPGDSGADEDQWRARFAQLHQEISSLEAQLTEDRARVESSVPQLSGGVPRTAPEVAEARARIERNERSLQQARAQLESLDREATLNAVPREWRRPAAR